MPLVINTSFNKKGDPIVESPYDALETFQDMDLDILVLNGLIIKKRGLDKKIYAVRDEAEQHIVRNLNPQLKIYDLSSSNFASFVDSLRSDFPTHELICKDQITLYREYVQLLRNGRKVTTIRYRPKGLHYPGNLVLPLIDTGYRGLNDTKGEDVGKVEVIKFMVKTFGCRAIASKFADHGDKPLHIDELYQSSTCRFALQAEPKIRCDCPAFGCLNNEDGKDDGFNDEGELKAALSRIYGHVKENEYVTIYSVKMV